MKELRKHAFEAGRRGKPDELDSIIAHRLGAVLLDCNRNARFDLRVEGSYDIQANKQRVDVGGEVTGDLLTPQTFDALASEVCNTYNEIHRTNLDRDDFVLRFGFKPQSSALAVNGRAGDSGNPLAVAIAGAPLLLPWERYLAVHLRNVIDNIYQNDGKLPQEMARSIGITRINGLRADGKIGVRAWYDGAHLDSFQTITIAAEHEEYLSIKHLRRSLERVASYEVRKLQEQYDLAPQNPSVVVNGLGAWNSGGWRTDRGSREAKPYRDGFATHGCCEDSFSGEDPSKPSATGSFAARLAAVWLIEQGLGEYANVALEYQIGREEVGVDVQTWETSTHSQRELEQLVRANIPLHIGDVANLCKLRDPALYRRIAQNADFFHDTGYVWNNPSTVSTGEPL